MNDCSITKFSIIGERCSGTNFLEKVMINSFKMEPIKGSTTTIDHKHWMQPENFKDKIKSENVLIIGIIREPVQWLASLYRKKYHVPFHMRGDYKTFMTSEWYSINDEGNREEIIHDRHPYTKDRFKNIFELRKVKSLFLLGDMPKLVKNYILIKYEDLLENMPMILSKISNITGLPCLNNSQHLVKKPKIHTFPRSIMKLIQENIDKNVEKSLGYIIS
jgi:hypothetical protein